MSLSERALLPFFASQRSSEAPCSGRESTLDGSTWKGAEGARRASHGCLVEAMYTQRESPHDKNATHSSHQQPYLRRMAHRSSGAALWVAEFCPRHLVGRSSSTRRGGQCSHQLPRDTAYPSARSRDEGREPGESGRAHANAEASHAPNLSRGGRPRTRHEARNDRPAAASDCSPGQAPPDEDA